MNWRSTLGVTNTNTDDIISRKYKTLILKTHPNKGGSASEFRNVRDAWETYQKHKASFQPRQTLQAEIRALGMTPSRLYPVTQVLKRVFRGKSRNHIWKLVENDAMRPLITKRFSKLGRFLASHTKKIPNPMSTKDTVIVEDRLRRAIKTTTYGLERAVTFKNADSDMFWYTLALYVALEYQLAFTRASRLPDWPVRLDTKAPATRISGLQYTIPKGFEHIHDDGIVTLANGFGSRYATSYMRR